MGTNKTLYFKGKTGNVHVLYVYMWILYTDLLKNEFAFASYNLNIFLIFEIWPLKKNKQFSILFNSTMVNITRKAIKSGWDLNIQYILLLYDWSGHISIIIFTFEEVPFVC